MVQNILFSIFLGVAVAVPLAILKALLGSNYTKPLGVLVAIGMFGLAFWLIIVNAAVMGVEQSN